MRAGSLQCMLHACSTLTTCAFVIDRRVLMIDRKWGEMILNGCKKIEVRHEQIRKHLGKRVGLCFNGTGRVFGFVTFTSNIKFDALSWKEEKVRHCCEGEKVPYKGKAWGWVCTDPEWLSESVAIQRKTGAQIFQLLKRSDLS